MTDDYAYMIKGAQNFISTQIQKKWPDKMLGSNWDRKSIDFGPDEYGLVIYRGKKKLVFSFTKDELIEDYGSTTWKVKLLTRVNEIIRRMER